MFERFTHAARDVVVQAQEHARSLGQSPIGTQHVLLSLLADPHGPVATLPALTNHGVSAASVRAAVVRLSGPGPEAVPPTSAEADAEDAAALKAIGIDLDAVRRTIEENFGPGALRLPHQEPPRRGFLRRAVSRSSTRGHIPFSPRSKKVLELSLREAIRLKHNYIAPEHILLGVVREGDGLAMRILAEAGVDPAQLREDVTRSLRAQAA